MSRSLLWTIFVLGLVLVGGYAIWRLLSKPAQRAGSGAVLAPVGGVVGWVNSAFNTVTHGANTATGVADAADRVLGSIENISDRFSHWGEGDTGDN